jgi:hydrogenase expression/formation protein HypC
MCIGVPVQVSAVSNDGQSATVEYNGQSQLVSLMMLEQTVAVGDYLVIQVGGFAVEKLAPEQAVKAIALQQALAEGDFERAAQLY